MSLARWILLALISLCSLVIINGGFHNDDYYIIPEEHFHKKPQDWQWWEWETITKKPPQKKIRPTKPKNMASDEGICSATCVKKKTEKPCSVIIQTCPMNECVLQRNQHCNFECNGVMCGSTCNAETARCYLKCTGIKCDVECNARRCRAECFGIGCTARCHGERCIAQCTGKNCTATCDGDNCIASEFTCHGYKCQGKRHGYFKSECDGRFCDSRCYSHPKPCRLKCTGNTCSSKCVGPECTAECIGKTCNSKCHGAGCNSTCLDNPCEAQCHGESCTSKTGVELSNKILHFNHPASEAYCLGSHCRSECIGQSCGARCNGLNCTVECTGPFCDEEKFCTHESCFPTTTECTGNCTETTTTTSTTTVEGPTLPAMPPPDSYRVKLALL